MLTSSMFTSQTEDQLIMDPFKANSKSMSLFFAEPVVLTKEPTVRIQCLSGSMIITVKDPPPSPDGKFSGMIYPKGLSKNSTCLSEYRFVLLDNYFESSVDHKRIPSFAISEIMKDLCATNCHFGVATRCHKKM